jgi:excisionase family DNA binding protein
MTVDQVAERLEVKRSVIYALCADGVLAHIRIGRGRGTIRVTEEDLADFIARSRVEARPRPPVQRNQGTGLAVRSILGEMLAEEERRKVERERKNAEKERRKQTENRSVT